MDPKIANIIEQVIQICIKSAYIKEIFLYGSRAKGTHMKKSDIDIALKGSDIDIETLLDEIASINTLLKIDLVDIENCSNELLKKEVEKDGITIYSEA